MGEPAIPTPAQRKATHELAIAIVESVRNDEPMPLGLDPWNVEEMRPSTKLELEQLVFRLAQELVLSSIVLWAECLEPPTTLGGVPCGWTGEMAQLIDRGNGVLRCPGCGSSAIKEDIVP